MNALQNNGIKSWLGGHRPKFLATPCFLAEISAAWSKFLTKIKILIFFSEHIFKISTGYDILKVIDKSDSYYKQKDKMYHHHTGYPGGIESISFEKMMQKKPERVIEKAVKGMLPKGPLGREMFRKLKVYADDQHQHAAQQPQVLEI